MAALSKENGFPYVRIDSSLLRSFDGMPEPALADPNDKRPPRIFELRTYESHTQATLAKKIAMFNGGEIAIFQHVGMRPIFFGETLIGPRQPSLTYMLSFDDLAAREKLWHAFRDRSGLEEAEFPAGSFRRPDCVEYQQRDPAAAQLLDDPLVGRQTSCYQSDSRNQRRFAHYRSAEVC